MQVKLKILIDLLCLFSCKSIIYQFNSQMPGTESKRVGKIVFSSPYTCNLWDELHSDHCAGNWIEAWGNFNNCEWTSQNLYQSPFTFLVPFLLMPKILFFLFSDSDIQGIAGSHVECQPRKGSTLRNSPEKSPG